MKDTGIVRKLDSMCRLVLPRELLKTRDLKPTDPVEFYVESDDIVIEKVNTQNAGSVRNIDTLGRVSIPHEILHIRDITAHDAVHFFHGWVANNRQKGHDIITMRCFK